MKPQPRILSLQEANALLPAIEAILCRILEKKESYDRLHDHLLIQELICQAPKPAAPTAPQNGFTADEILEADARTLDEAWASLRKDAEEILNLGGILRNMERGCVDFLGKHEGRQVYFCWKRGEKTVQYYHSACDGQTDRHLLG